VPGAAAGHKGHLQGERLYYDYNGSEHEYPTHHFV